MTLTCAVLHPPFYVSLLTRPGRDIGSSLLRVLTAFSSNTLPSKQIPLFSAARRLTSQSHDLSDHETYPPPRRQVRATNAPRILYDGQDLRVTVHRTVEYDVELPPPPLPTHHLGTAIVLKDMNRASSSGSSTVGSSSGSEFSRSGAASPA